MSKINEIKEHIESHAPPDDRKEQTRYMDELASLFKCDISIVRQAVRHYKREAEVLNMPINEYVRSDYYDAPAIEHIQKCLYAQILSEHLEPPILTDDDFINKVIPELVKAYSKDFYIDLADSKAAFDRIILEAGKANLSIHEYWNTKNSEIQKELNQIKERIDKEGDFQINPMQYPLITDSMILIEVKEAHEKIMKGIGSYASPYLMILRLIRRREGGGGDSH